MEPLSVRPIYLDFNASTPIDPRAAPVMRPYLEEAYGNPSSPHWGGRPAREAVERARSQVAGLLGAAPDEIVFTSGNKQTTRRPKGRERIKSPGVET